MIRSTREGDHFRTAQKCGPITKQTVRISTYKDARRQLWEERKITKTYKNGMVWVLTYSSVISSANHLNGADDTLLVKWANVPEELRLNGSEEHGEMEICWGAECHELFHDLVHVSDRVFSKADDRVNGEANAIGQHLDSLIYGGP